MNQKPENRRCSECSRAIPPDPKIKDRRVTCGSPSCQRKRHAKRCRSWRQNHPDLSGHHYSDVIVPYRDRYPEYQRWWRWKSKLCEIREELGNFCATGIPALKRLLVRGLHLTRKLSQVPENAFQMVVSGSKTLQAVGELLKQLHDLVQGLETP